MGPASLNLHQTFEKQYLPYNDIRSRTVLAHGCFDLLHPGHIRHLQEARKLGDKLVVSVTHDRYVNKGPGRPHLSLDDRIEMLKALDCVDDVIVSESENAVNVIREIRPAVFVKGGDYNNAQDDNLMLERSAVEDLGGRLHFTAPTHWHSSDILKAKQFDPRTADYLARSRHFLGDIREAFEKAKDLRVLFVGETIIDEYRYVRPMGKCSKEPLIATVMDDTEEFAGGVVAAKENCATSSIRHALPCPQAITKTRFVSIDYNRKLFEVYSHDRIDIAESVRERWHKGLRKSMDNADVVVVLDFGHGLINDETRGLLRNAEFLAVNAQSNAGNYGFNLVTKYAGAAPDFVCVDAPEARLAVADQHSRLEIVAKNLLGQTNCANVIVTHGQNGTIAVRPNATRHIPVFSHDVVDTMGAGDAFLAVTAPLVAVGLDLEAAAIVGNAAGAIKCSILGHRRPIGRDELIASVEALLK